MHACTPPFRKTVKRWTWTKRKEIESFRTPKGNNLNLLFTLDNLQKVGNQKSEPDAYHRNWSNKVIHHYSCICEGNTSTWNYYRKVTCNHKWINPMNILISNTTSVHVLRLYEKLSSAPKKVKYYKYIWKEIIIISFLL